MFPPDYIEIHASACGERFVLYYKEFANIQPILISVISNIIYLIYLCWYTFCIWIFIYL